MIPVEALEITEVSFNILIKIAIIIGIIAKEAAVVTNETNIVVTMIFYQAIGGAI